MQCCDDFNLNSFFLSIHIRRRCFAKPFLPFSTSRNLRTPKIFSIYWKLFICCSVVYSFSLSNSLYPKWIHCECGRGLRHFQHYLCMQAHYCFLTCLIGKNDWIYEPHRTAPKRNHNFSRHKWHFGVKMIYGKCPIEICCDCIKIAMTWAIFREGKMHSMPRKSGGGAAVFDTMLRRHVAMLMSYTTFLEATENGLTRLQSHWLCILRLSDSHFQFSLHITLNSLCWPHMRLNER